MFELLQIDDMCVFLFKLNCYLHCRQLRNLEKALGNEVRVCDRTALILDIFSQRAATREATLQVFTQPHPPLATASKSLFS